MIAIIILITSFKSSTANRLDKIEHELQRIREQSTQVTIGKAIVPPIMAVDVSPEKEAPMQPFKEPAKEALKTPEEKSLSSELEALLKDTTSYGKEQKLPEQIPLREETIPEPIHLRQPVSSPSHQTFTERKPSFLESNPDLEKFIGENLVSKIGIGILVLAIGFFVKYAIDNDWIGPVGRVSVGLLCGGILAAVAHRLRLHYKAFSSVLIGGALAIFYFTITLAYHDYGLFSQTVAFIIMVVITGFAVVLSQLYNRQELAIIALIGGFATPFMVSEEAVIIKACFLTLSF